MLLEQKRIHLRCDKFRETSKWHLIWYENWAFDQISSDNYIDSPKANETRSELLFRPLERLNFLQKASKKSNHLRFPHSSTSECLHHSTENKYREVLEFIEQRTQQLQKSCNENNSVIMAEKTYLVK